MRRILYAIVAAMWVAGVVAPRTSLAANLTTTTIPVLLKPS